MGAKGVVRVYREAHHLVAQMFASGCTPAFIKRHTGISQRRLSLLAQDPTFQELIAEYSKQSAEKFAIAEDTYTDLVISNRMRGERTVADHFDQAEDTGEMIPILTANRISMDRADRTGMGKNMLIKVEHDFASMLESAIDRSNKAKVVEASPTVGVDPPPSMAAAVGTSGVGTIPPRTPLRVGGSTAVPQPIRRRKLA